MYLIQLTADDLAALIVTLRGRIEETERHERVCGEQYSAEQSKNTAAYLRQLGGCLNACESARQAGPASAALSRARDLATANGSR